MKWYVEDAFLSDAGNFEIVPLGVILNIDDSILPILQRPPLCAYERDAAGTFQEIKNYDWDDCLNG